MLERGIREERKGGGEERRRGGEEERRRGGEEERRRGGEEERRRGGEEERRRGGEEERRRWEIGGVEDELCESSGRSRCELPAAATRWSCLRQYT